MDRLAVLRAGNVVVQRTLAVASSAWVLVQLGEASEALNRLREGEQLLKRWRPGQGAESLASARSRHGTGTFV